MSIVTQRAKYIRQHMMKDALFGDIKKPGRFGVIYGFIDFVSKGNGNLMAHPKTGEDPQVFAAAYPEAAESYRIAVKKWAMYREEVRKEYLEK